MKTTPLNTKRDQRERRVATALAAVGVAGALAAITTIGTTIDSALSGAAPSATQILLTLLFVLIAAVFTGARVTYSNRSAVRSEIMLRRELAQTSLRAPTKADAEGEEQAGAVINMMTDGAERLTLYRQTFLPQVAGALAIPVLTIIWIAAAYDWLTALVLAICLPLIPALVRGFMMVMRRVSTRSRKARANLAAAYLDAIEGIDTLQMLGASKRVAADLAERGERNRRATMKLLAGNQLVLFVIDISFSLFMVAAAALMAILRFSSGNLTIGQASAIVLMSVLLLEPIDQVGAFFYVGMGGMAAQRAAKRYLAGQPDHSPAAPAEPVRSAGPVAISAEGIHAGYERDGMVLQGADLLARHGERVAIVGPSGQGKSTLLRVLSGQLEATKGRVFLGDSSADAVQLRDETAVVAQGTWMFAGTVAYNLRLVSPEATDEQLWEALRRARVADDIETLPLGLDTLVGERGYGLSGGQIQRISLARAFLSGRKVLLLDEPTSAVDVESERLISQTLEELDDSYTVVMVTHREGLLPGATRTVRVQGGRTEIVEDGQPLREGVNG